MNDEKDINSLPEELLERIFSYTSQYRYRFNLFYFEIDLWKSKFKFELNRAAESIALID